MNCTKCGKEITDGRRKICKECAEKEKKEKEEMKAKKAAEKASKETKEEVKENKEINKEQTKENNTKIIVAVIAIVVLIAICIVAVMLSSKGNVGNTIGNIRNYGYSATDGKDIYYLSPNETSTAVGIFKIKANGKGEPKQLYMEDTDIVSINVHNGWLYFIGVSSDQYSQEDTVDNKIYKMKTNGDKLTVINDNEFNNDCYEIYVIGNSIYYIGTDNNIYKMSLDGTERTLVSENSTGYLGVTEKYIIYNHQENGAEDYTTYIMNIDGTNQRALIEGERLYSVNIEGDYVYYTNVDKQICKTKIDSGVSEVVLDTTAYNMNLNNGYIYFLNYKDSANKDFTVCLYKIKADGSETEATTIKELDSYSSFINIIGNWVIYMDSNENEGFLNLIKTDGSDEVRVYSLDYSNYYDMENDVQDTTTPEVEQDTTDPAPTEDTNVVINTTDGNDVVNQ